MNIIRKYKLHILNYNTLTEKELTDLNIIFDHVKYSKQNEEVINFIYNNFFNLKQVKAKKCPDIILYFNNKGEHIFQHNLKDNFFSFNYYLIWEYFKKQFKYSQDEISILIKCIIEDAYKDLLKNK